MPSCLRCGVEGKEWVCDDCTEQDNQGHLILDGVDLSSFIINVAFDADNAVFKRFRAAINNI